MFAGYDQVFEEAPQSPIPAIEALQDGKLGRAQ